MRKNVLKVAYLSAALVFFMSCSNETEVLTDVSAEMKSKSGVENKQIELVDGVLKFKDAESFMDVLLNFNDGFADEISAKRGSGFKSLESKYEELIESRNLLIVRDKTGEEIADDNVIENKVNSPAVRSLLNEDGVMIIGNEIYKVLGNYAYITPNSGKESLSRAKKADVNSLKNARVEKIIYPLEADNSEIQTKASMPGGAHDRSYTFVCTNDKNRREHVTFNANLLRTSGQGATLELSMEGRAQIHQFYGWGSTFSDEMTWAEIHVNSGSYYFAGNHLAAPGTRNFPTGLKSRSTNQKVCNFMFGFRLDENNLNSPKLPESGISNIKINVTFKFKKSEGQPTSNYQSAYTNAYHN